MFSYSILITLFVSVFLVGVVLFIHPLGIKDYNFEWTHSQFETALF